MQRVEYLVGDARLVGARVFEAACARLAAEPMQPAAAAERSPVEAPTPNEIEIVKRATTNYSFKPQTTLKAEEILSLQQLVRKVPVADHVYEFAVDLARYTRPVVGSNNGYVKEMVNWGAGPRATPNHGRISGLARRGSIGGVPFTDAEINSGDPDLIRAATDRLIEAVNTMNMAFSIDGAYVRLPEGRLGLQHAWSGDLAAAPYYAPEDEDPSVLRWMWPPKHGRKNAGYVSNDSMAVPRNAQNPVLAHHFLNYMLDEGPALKNFSWVLYQPPQNSINPEDLVSEEYIPENVASTVIQQEDYRMGQIPVQLTPEADARWLEAWSQVQAGG